jgi:hypothetical protein
LPGVSTTWYSRGGRQDRKYLLHSMLEGSDLEKSRQASVKGSVQGVCVCVCACVCLRGRSVKDSVIRDLRWCEWSSGCLWAAGMGFGALSVNEEVGCGTRREADGLLASLCTLALQAAARWDALGREGMRASFKPASLWSERLWDCLSEMHGFCSLGFCFLAARQVLQTQRIPRSPPAPSLVLVCGLSRLHGLIGHELCTCQTVDAPCLLSLLSTSLLEPGLFL